MDKIIKIIVTLFVVIAAASVAYVVYVTPSVPSATPSAENVSDNIVYYFYGQGCPHCAKIEPFMENITEKYPDVDIRKLEVWYNQTNQQVYAQVNAQAGISTPGVPEIVIGKTVLVGEIDIPAKLEGYIQAIEKKK
ncbi:MAG: thioredoxin family protein [Methanoregula sp.]|jgi:thiol-disulfide isomerase/thioredoxin|uniref:thioredoxin domain-containing protein n=1 Tax=Methanoregula sp. TaxID=2052170 RepID=UPI003D11781B